MDNDLWDLDNTITDECDVVNKYLESKEEGMNLLTSILACGSIDGRLEKQLKDLDQLIDVDYNYIANQEDLPNESEMVDKLDELRNSIHEVVKFPFLLGKNIVAVGGGFSAGKSRFVNSILDDDILPTDTRPTTSIPTFITKGCRKSIYSFNVFGNKKQIDEEGIKAISHAFYEKYKLSFTKILKYIVLQSDKLNFENIAFLDTPGYTKAELHKAEDNTDEHIAHEHLKKADYLIWLVDIEKGTVPKQDIDFIKKLEFSKPIFFIFTKADKKEISDVEKILQTAQTNLNASNIKVKAITAYSSFDKKEYINCELQNFLLELNNYAKKNDFSEKTNSVFDVYKNFHDDKLKKVHKKMSQINKMKLFNENEDYNDIIIELEEENKSIISEEKRILNEFEKLRNSFDKYIENLLNDLNAYIEDEKNRDLEIEKLRQIELERQKPILIEQAQIKMDVTFEETSHSEELKAAVEKEAKEAAAKMLEEMKIVEEQQILRQCEREHLNEAVLEWKQEREYEENLIQKRMEYKNALSNVEINILELRATEQIKQIEESIFRIKNINQEINKEFDKIKSRINDINTLKQKKEYEAKVENEILLEKEIVEKIKIEKNMLIDIARKVIEERETVHKKYEEIRYQRENHVEDLKRRAKEFLDKRKREKDNALFGNLQK